MTNEVIESGPFAGFEVIHRYTREQALADGVLVDVTAPAKDCGFSVPVAMTAALFADCESWASADERRGDASPRDQVVRRLLHFACETIRASARTPTDRRVLSLTHFAGRTCQAVVYVGPGDAGEPVVTLMYPGEE
ncbi:MAG: hypothetical protein IJI03_19955 [Rudaea sp.]|nr:hypothetical protein [Rudaea sp.]